MNEAIADRLIEEMIARSVRPQYKRDFRRESALGNMGIQVRRCNAALRLIASNEGSQVDYFQIEILRDYMTQLINA